MMAAEAAIFEPLQRRKRVRDSTVLVLGRRGVGKSVVVNTLLHRRAVNIVSSTKSATLYTAKSGEFKDMRVIDTPPLDSLPKELFIDKLLRAPLLPKPTIVLVVENDLRELVPTLRSIHSLFNKDADPKGWKLHDDPARETVRMLFGLALQRQFTKIAIMQAPDRCPMAKVATPTTQPRPRTSSSSAATACTTTPIQSASTTPPRHHAWTNCCKPTDENSTANASPPRSSP